LHEAAIADGFETHLQQNHRIDRAFLVEQMIWQTLSI
jgi:hypothetical protein